MEYLHRLPFIIGAVMAVVIGAYSYNSGIDIQTVYLRMAICLVGFFIIGKYIKNAIIKTMEEIEEKREQEEQEEQEELQRLQELESINREETKAKEKGNQKVNVSQIDYRVDDSSYSVDESEEFSPLTVEKISKKDEFR